MKTFLLCVVLLTQGCGFLVGAGLGALGTGAAYEYNAKDELDKLEAERRAGRISQGEYEKRKAQIGKSSVVY